MKKITAIVVAVAALYSTTALASNTPAARELSKFDHILAVANKNRESKASEFVIYHHQDKPCPPKGKGKGKHHGKKEGAAAPAKHHKKGAAKAKKAEEKKAAEPAAQ